MLPIRPTKFCWTDYLKMYKLYQKGVGYRNIRKQYEISEPYFYRIMKRVDRFVKEREDNN